MLPIDAEGEGEAQSTLLRKRRLGEFSHTLSSGCSTPTLGSDGPRSRFVYGATQLDRDGGRAYSLCGIILKRISRDARSRSLKDIPIHHYSDICDLFL